MEIRTVPMSAINRPLYMVRSLDQDKLAELTQSIAEEGLREPVSYTHLTLLTILLV